MYNKSFLKGFEKSGGIFQTLGKARGYLKGRSQAIRQTMKEDFGKGLRKGVTAGNPKAAPTIAAKRKLIKETAGPRGYSPAKKILEKAKKPATIAAMGAVSGGTAVGAGAYAMKDHKDSDPRLASLTDSHPSFYQ